MPCDLTSLSQMLHAADSADRKRAAQSLASLGDQAQAAAVPLVRSCGDPDESVREWSVAALEKIAAPDPADVQSLISLVDAESQDVAFWAVTLLGRLDEAPAAGVEALARSLADSRHLAVRQRAAWALGRIGSPAAAAVADLESATGAADSRLARLARRSIKQIQDSAS